MDGRNIYEVSNEINASLNEIDSKLQLLEGISMRLTDLDSTVSSLHDSVKKIEEKAENAKGINRNVASIASFTETTGYLFGLAVFFTAIYFIWDFISNL